MATEALLIRAVNKLVDFFSQMHAIYYDAIELTAADRRDSCRFEKLLITGSKVMCLHFGKILMVFTEIERKNIGVDLKPPVLSHHLF